MDLFIRRKRKVIKYRIKEKLAILFFKTQILERKLMEKAVRSEVVRPNRG
jgi:hypothetical protein